MCTSRLTRSAPTTSRSEELVDHLDRSRVTEGDFEPRVLKSDEPVLVFFWARWCQPCLTMGERVVDLVHRYRGQVDFVSVDVDRDEGLARNQRVAALPTLLIFLRGEVLHRFEGLTDEEELRSAVEKVLATG